MSEPTPALPSPLEAQPESKPERVAPAPPWAPPVGLALVFLGLCAATWRRWCDPLIDFGREVYLPWQLLEGRGLHDELASLFGPLSPYFNALALDVGGASVTTLALANLVLAAGLAGLVYRALLALTDRLTASLGTLTLLVVFVFGNQLDDVANYNFVWPYAHEATHGALLLVAGLVALGAALRPGADSRSWVLAGGCLGSTLLTKPEVALAAAAGGVAALAWHLCVPRGPGRWRGPAAFLAAGLVPAGAFALALGPRAVLAPWLAVGRADVSRSSFYAALMGVDAPLANGAEVLGEAVLWGGAILALLAADRRFHNRPERQPLVRILGVAMVGLLVVHDFPWLGRPLPVLVPVAGGWLALTAWRRRHDNAEVARLAPLLPWAAAAWVLLAKTLLQVRLVQYGFTLALPATLLAVALGLGVIPRLLAQRHPRGGWLVRPAAIAAVLMILIGSGLRSALVYAQHTVPVGRGADLHYGKASQLHPTGTVAAAALERLEALPPGGSLAVLPEGAMLNVLTRRPNPTPYHQLMPPELQVYGDDRVLAAYRASPPDYVLVIERDALEYGFERFDHPDWGGPLMAWLREGYELLEEVPGPDGGLRWGFSLWRLRER